MILHIRRKRPRENAAVPECTWPEFRPALEPRDNLAVSKVSCGCFPERLLVNSAGDWGPSKPTAVPDFILEMRRRGHPDSLIRKIVYDNPLEFFGQKALTSLATAEMALKFNALLVPVWGLRDKDGLHFNIQVETPIEHSDPLTMTRTFNTRLEAVIRDNMDQWLWIHRRWKDRDTPLGQARAKELEELERKYMASDRPN